MSNDTTAVVDKTEVCEVVLLYDFEKIQNRFFLFIYTKV